MKSQFPIPPDYAARVYAGVLGKIIGVYLGRPIEGWDHARIERDLGEVSSYVHERLGQPLIVTDDDISGTFTFLRALEDCDVVPTSAQIGDTWLNYIIENKAILWWGGMGMSTEHTAFLRLKHGVSAPQSGSIRMNGQVVAEQIGAQIFIDGWGLICPGDPQRAAKFALEAASVSHDGEAIYGAQVVAALVAAAFAEPCISNLLDIAVDVIPKDSLTSKLIADVRSWHSEGLSWREGFQSIASCYGYDRYGGNCHIIPNHALIIHAMLHGDGDFGKSLMIVNTCGWDTDCNSGNVGCILGVLGGLTGIPPELRDPVRDRMYLPTADGGRCITDALREAYQIVNYSRALHGLAPERPKEGARFHFSLPGSLQAFSNGTNIDGSLAFDGRAGTPTFTPPDARNMGGYGMLASPTLYPGQTVTARVSGKYGSASLFVGVYDSENQVRYIAGDSVTLNGSWQELSWTIPETEGYPIVEVGVSGPPPVRPFPGDGGADRRMLLDSLTWQGTPEALFRKVPGKTWREAWVNGMSEWPDWGSPFRLIQNEGTGLLITGTREWQDYRVSSTIRPHLAERVGIAARVQGMKRWYGLLLCRDGFVRLVKNGWLTLAEAPFDWTFGEEHVLTLEVSGNQLTGWVDGQMLVSALDSQRPLQGGGIAFVLEGGRMDADEIAVGPIAKRSKAEEARCGG